MKYIVAIVLLSFGVLGFVMLYQSRTPQPHEPLSGPAGELDHPGDLAGMITGKVIETMDSGGYTYVQVDNGREKIWAAGPLTEVATGDMVSFPPGMQMHDFTSETLNRTFETIYFVPAINTGAAAETGPSPHAHLGEVDRNMDYSRVEVPEGGMRIDAIYDGKDSLVGKEVIVSGKVVKFTSSVMNRNWVHIRDGSGAEGSNDLTVTTDATVAVGDVVIVRGELAVDKDFGFGYSYEVIVEEATVITER